MCYILAEAGTGKSTLLRRMAFDLCNDFQQIVFWYKGERRLNFDIIETIYKSTKCRVFIFIDRGSKYVGNLENLRRDCIAAKVPITMIIADRTNEWHANSGNNFRYTEGWTLNRLSDQEIQGIINKLDEFNCLGNLKEYTNQQRLETFRGFSDRQSLIALREATEGKSFDELVIDEFESIPDELARRAYLHICAMHAHGKGIRTTSLVRSLGVKLHDFSVCYPHLDGLVDYRDDVYVSRHAVIAKIVFFSVGEAARIDILEQLIMRLDLGYTTDDHIFRNLVNNQELISSVGSIETRRRLFEVLKSVQPADAFIEQHEARMEIRSINDGGSLDRAEQLLKSSLKRTDNATSIRHTAGLLYIERANQSSGPEKRVYMAKAVQEFIELTKRDSCNDYAWVSLVESRIALGSIYIEQEEKYGDIFGMIRDDLKYVSNVNKLNTYLSKIDDRLEENSVYTIKQSYLNSDIQMTFVPYVGITSARFHHHGTVMDYELELLEYKVDTE